jgi:outer membrane receptor protein involved in Fe transport
MLTLACVVFFAAAAHAQFRAGIEGTVTDSTGAVVKGAKITVTSQETGASQESTANDEGFYSVSHLAPGLYTINASLAGFKTKVINDVLIKAEETSGVNLVLDPGSVTEQVTVNGDTLPTLDTEDASLTGTITKQQIEDLPQFRGDPFELLRLTPGVFGLGARSSGGDSTNFPNYSGPGGSNRGVFQTENAVQVSANGSRVEANGYQLDGVSANSQGHGGASVITPNTESVKEVKIEVSPYSAENSSGAGAIVEVVTQNGTNNLHGSAVLRTQSPGLNAFQRWGGPNGASPNRDNLLLHSYLGSLGGPIWKNKLFAFFSFEHLKLAGNSRREHSWEETSQLVGNFPSSSLAAKIFAVPGTGFSNPKILTASSTCAAFGLPEGSPTPDGGPAVCRTVSGGIDIGSNIAGGFVANTPRFKPDPSCPVANPNCIQWYDSSVGGGLDGNPDIASIEYDARSDNTTTTQYNGRIDFNVTKNDLVAFSLFTVPLTNTFLPGGWVDGRQYNTFHHDGKNETAALLWNRTVNPNTINEARMNVTRWYFDELKSNTQAPFGVPQVNIIVNPLNNTKFGAGFPFGPGVFYQTKYVFRDTLSKVQGTHVLKFGGEFSKEQSTNVSTGNARPQYDFNNLWNFANDAPNDEGGITFFPWTGATTYNPTSGVPTDFRKYFRTTTYAFFGQDTWKVKPNLTLTLGLRYDYFSPLHEKFGRISNLVLGQGSAALTGAKIKTGGDFTKPDRNNFGPQLGFAWSPRNTFGHEWNNRFVLRGGIGVAYNRVAGAQLWRSAANPPSFVSAGVASTCSFDNASCADRSQIVYAFSSGGIKSFAGYPANPSTRLTFDPTTGLPQPTSQFYTPPNITGAVQNLATPYTWHFSMEGQYDLGHNWVGALSYQGSQSRKYMRDFDHALIDARPTGLNTFTDSTVNLIGNVTMSQTDVNSHYNALLARISHRMSKGLEFTGSYRYSKSVDQCSGDEGCKQTYPWDQRLETGPSDFDVTHSFTANTLYELPFFKARHDWLYTAAGGWKLGMILTLNSGFPWTPVSNGNCQSIGVGFDALCSVRPAAYKGGAGSDFSTSTFQKVGGNFPGGGLKYFTPAVASSSGTPPVPGVGRNSFRGPRYTGIDMSFGKRFTLPKMRVFGENAGFELKANAFNVFNKLNLTPFGFNSDSTNITSSKFGQATGALGGRVFEFIGRFSF